MARDNRRLDVLFLVAAIVAFLEAHHYARILHVESGTRISSANARVAREGHLFASWHLLAR